MKRVKLDAEKREISSKGRLNKYRNEGYIPGIVYGKEVSNIPVVLKEKDLLTLRAKEGTNVIIDLAVGNEIYPTIFKEIQRNPIGGKVIHVDFEAVNLEKPVYTTISVVAVGEARGVKVGGVFDQELYELEVEGLLTDLPDRIEVDVSNLDIKESIHVRDLELPENVKVYTPMDATVVSVVTPTVEEVVAPVEEVAAEGAEAPVEEKGPAREEKGTLKEEKVSPKEEKK